MSVMERPDGITANITSGELGQSDMPRRNPYIEDDNDASLRVYRRLKQAVQECEPYSAPYLNLVSVFFHDLMCILSGFAIRVREVEGPYRPQTQAEWAPLDIFPYLALRDVDKGVKPSSKKYGLAAPKVRPRRRWASATSHLIGRFTGARDTVAIAKPSALIPRKLVAAIFRARMKLVFPSPISLVLPGLYEQLHCLNAAIEEMFEELEWPGFPGPLIEVVNRHIQALAIEGRPEIVPYQALICGSLIDPFNRLLAARTRAAGMPVIQISHGAGEGYYDEPPYGYGDRSFASTLLGFGPAGNTLAATGSFVETLDDYPVYVESDAPDARELYHGPEVRPLVSLEGKSLFYLPTTFHGNHRYGPFHDVPDRMYLEWQEALFREFPEAVWKGHPKMVATHRLMPKAPKSTSMVRLQECIEQIDVFMFDHVSTAFCLAAATSKPIIFFDIGLRNLSKAARRAIVDRCVQLPVDLEDACNLRERVLASAYEPATNSFTSQCSLATNPSPGDRVEATIRIVRGLL